MKNLISLLLLSTGFALADIQPRATSQISAAKPAERVEHDYTWLEDWTIHYFTDSKGAFHSASMIRPYDGGYLRLSVDATHYHLDTSGDWKIIEKALAGTKDASLKIKLAGAKQAASEDRDAIAQVIDDEGDRWLRISQPLGQSGGMQDILKNGQAIHLTFANGATWDFDLTGNHAAWKKLQECLAKHQK